MRSLAVQQREWKVFNGSKGSGGNDWTRGKKHGRSRRFNGVDFITHPSESW